MKVLVIGASCSGKTTLVRFLRATTQLPILEIDEELVRVNDGASSSSIMISSFKYWLRRLSGKCWRWTPSFSSGNTDYFTAEDLEAARRRGFKVIQLELALDQLQERNLYRVANDGYPDNSEWLPGMIEYQATMKSKGLFHRTISADSPVEVVAAELLSVISRD